MINGNKNFRNSVFIVLFVATIIFIIFELNILSLIISSLIGFPIAYLIIRKLSPDDFKLKGVTND